MHIRKFCCMHACVWFGEKKTHFFSRVQFALRTARQAREMNAAGEAYANYHLKLSKMSFQMLGCAFM